MSGQPDSPNTLLLNTKQPNRQKSAQFIGCGTCGKSGGTRGRRAATRDGHTPLRKCTSTTTQIPAQHSSAEFAAVARPYQQRSEPTRCGHPTTKLRPPSAHVLTPPESPATTTQTRKHRLCGGSKGGGGRRQAQQTSKSGCAASHRVADNAPMTAILEPSPTSASRRAPPAHHGARNRRKPNVIDNNESYDRTGSAILVKATVVD